MADVIARFPSKSSDAVHEVKDPGDGGTCWCTCTGWKMSKSKPKACTHLRRLVGSVLNAAFVSGLDHPVKVATVEEVRADTPIVKSGAPRAMLAQEVGAFKSAPPWGDDRWVAEVKIDGMRLFHVVNADGSTRQYARSGNVHEVEWLRDVALPADTILDAELASDEFGAYANGKSKVKLYVFDVLRLDGVSMIDEEWSVRRQAVEMLVEVVGHPNMLTSTVLGVPRAEMVDEMAAKGGEGVMLKRRAAKYAEGKRSWDWLKAKVMTTYDVVIMDMEGVSVQPGFKGLRYGLMVGGKLTLVGTLGHTGTPADLAPYIGKVVEVHGYAQSKSGAIRHPHLLRIREDKTPEECTV